MTSHPLHIGVLFGTRPEAIKLAPVIRELRGRGVRTTVVTTGQHSELVDQVMDLFELSPDHDLKLMRHGAGLDYILSQALTGVAALLREIHPDALVVQGDTTSTLAASLAAFHARIPIAHVEAGLRSGGIGLPFPEEMNRRVVSLVARWNFAPTEHAAQNLRDENVSGDVAITGNTVVDAVHHILGSTRGQSQSSVSPEGPYLLATAHRRESWGPPIERIASALDVILTKRPELSLVFATHPNPEARDPVSRVLAGRERVQIVGPLDYLTFLQLLRGATLAISDSGGVQEEAPTLGVPVLVTREVTERPEGVSAGAVVMVGTEQDQIVAHALRLLEDDDARAEMARAGQTVYGDGHAAGRIADTLLRDLAKQPELGDRPA